MRLVLYQPDIPQNLGAALRLGTCLDVGIDIISPCGFPLEDKAIKRAAMDYGPCAKVSHHDSWEDFLSQARLSPSENTPVSGQAVKRLILLTTRASVPYTDFTFQADDYILLGRESAGVPETVHDVADHAVRVPMAKGARSLNVINSAAMILGEALRQTAQFPK